jgi:branched-chain amino acid transport system ATP-binding protein
MLSSSIHSLGKSPQALRRAEELLSSVGLAEMKDHYAYELSGGQQKLLEFARALMPDPQLILMDEPFAGVHPTVKELLFNRVREMNQGQGQTFILISHDVKSIRDLCHRLVVLSFGEKLMEGQTEEVLSNPEVIDAYLGRGEGVP